MAGRCWWTALLGACSSYTRLSTSEPGGSDLPSTFEPANTPTAPEATALPSSGCENPVLYTFPADGATDVYGGSTIWYMLEEPDENASIVVHGADGAVLPGASTVDGAVATWSGEFLSQTAMVVATLTTSCGQEIVEFTTSDVGVPLAVDVNGPVFAANLAEATWLEPWMVGQLLSKVTGQTALLWSPTVVDENAALMVAAGSSVRQDLCAETAWLPVQSWVDPTFVVSEVGVPLQLGQGVVALRAATVTGSIDAQATRIQFGRLTATLDTREIVSALDLGPRDDALCKLIEPPDPGCQPCDDGAPYCLPAKIDGLEADLVDFALVERDGTAIAADASCR